MNTPWLPMKSVVVPVDLSAESLAVLDKVRGSMVDDAGALHIVHVLPHLEPSEPSIVWGNLSNDDRAKHATDVIRQKLAAGQYDGSTIHVTFGNPGRQIVKYADSIKADLIVVAPKRHSNLESILVGSTAERVVRLAHCPVLVLRGCGPEMDC